MSLTPKNWSEFQHYKDRSPIWIKLHRKLLDNYEFACLPVASRALAPMLWLLASEYEDGKIDASYEAIAFRLRTSVEDFQEALKPLIDANFFISDSKPLARRKRVASLEKETEGEKEKRQNGAVATATRPTDFFLRFWEMYPKRKGSNPKKPASDSFSRALKAGADAEQIIAAVRRYRDECQREGQIGTPYVAQAVTWLNQQRWGDYANGGGEVVDLERMWAIKCERGAREEKPEGAWGAPPEFISKWKASRPPLQEGG